MKFKEGIYLNVANPVHPDVKTNTSLRLFQALHERLHSRILGFNNVESPSEDALLQEQNVVDVQRPETVGRVQVREETWCTFCFQKASTRKYIKVYSTVSLRYFDKRKSFEFCSERTRRMEKSRFVAERGRKCRLSITTASWRPLIL